MKAREALENGHRQNVRSRVEPGFPESLARDFITRNREKLT